MCVRNKLAVGPLYLRHGPCRHGYIHVNALRRALRRSSFAAAAVLAVAGRNLLALVLGGGTLGNRQRQRVLRVMVAEENNSVQQVSLATICLPSSGGYQ